MGEKGLYRKRNHGQYGRISGPVRKFVSTDSVSSETSLTSSGSRDSLLSHEKDRSEYRSVLRLWMNNRASASTSSSSETCTSKLSESDEKDEGTEADHEESRVVTLLPKVMNPKEKASSENNLLVANYTVANSNKVSGTKSAGNIAELENTANKSTFRDTGYYSFKSSVESVLSLDDSGTSRASSASLVHQRSLTSSETIPEVEEESTKPSPPPTSEHHSSSSVAKVSLSSGNIPDAVSSVGASKSSTLPSNLRARVYTQPQPLVQRPRPFVSSFFSTSGVLRKLTALRDESATSHRSSPRGRLRVRNRLSSGSDDTRHGKTLPHISVSSCPETSNRGSFASSERDSASFHDSDVEHVFTHPSRSQTSLSSFAARSESMTSVYSAAGGGRYGTVTVTGEVLFSLCYNYKAGAMEVHVKECRSLAPVDIKRNRSDPYVKVYLLPDKTKSGKRKTKVKKHTLSPVFDEVLKFYVTISELETRTLWLSVWHSDMFGRNDFLGEVMLSLGYEVFENPGMKWYPLQERLESPDSPLSYKGDLLLTLKYVPPDVTRLRQVKRPGVPAKGSLHVLVKEARNLMATRSNGTSDPFCKSYLLPDKSKASKQKTHVMKKTCNPRWNHTFVYDNITLEELDDRCLELTIWDYDKITSNDFLGGVRLSLGTGKHQGKVVDWMDSQGDEISLWKAVLDRPNVWVEGALLLRPSMQTRRS